MHDGDILYFKQDVTNGGPPSVCYTRLFFKEGLLEDVCITIKGSSCIEIWTDKNYVDDIDEYLQDINYTKSSKKDFDNAFKKLKQMIYRIV